MKSTRHHLESLDAFRGFTVAGMILVNNPGDWTFVYPQLLHADWNGCTIADLVFPFFIFIVGVATTFAFTRRREAGHGTRQLYARIVRRAALLVALGLVLNAVQAAPHLETLRFPGVLQRIGVVYLITAVVVLNTNVAGRLVTIMLLLAGHWALVMHVPFAGHPAGTFLPGVNLPATVDRAAFGGHVLTSVGDPEGLVGTIPAVATALLGELAGAWLRATPSAGRRIAGLVAGGGIAVATGLAWSHWWPLNKPMWTGSYAVFTAGVAAIVLAASYAVIDVADLKGWSRPFVWLGVNPLAIYFLSEFAGHLLERTIKWRLFWEVFMPALEPHVTATAVSLIVAVATVATWTAVAGVMYARNIRVQV